MPALLSAEGREALRLLATRRALLAFDFDGTLAPIVAQPALAQVPAATALRLCALARRWPVAVITGRTAADAAGRLGFTPHHVVGNHGAERLAAAGEPVPPHSAISAHSAHSAHSARSSPAAQAAEQALDHAVQHALDGCRDLLARHARALREQGIVVEDKRLSLALHYRGSRDREAERAWLDALRTTFDPGVLATHGHCVLNLTAALAADKGDALLALLRESGTSCSLVVGDDTNDEAAFAKAPPGSVSMRIGPDGTPSRAAFQLPSQTQVDALLDVLLALRA
jgi:trehalose 6-phosphate phosphatase